MTELAVGPLWTPTVDTVARSNIGGFTRWLREHRGVVAEDYDALWRWSVDDLAGFWGAVWDHFALGPPVDPSRVLVQEAMPGAVWFPDSPANLAGNILRPRADEHAVALVGTGEIGPTVRLTWTELRDRVASLAAAMRELGVRRGDVVAGYLPNLVETVVAFLATASLGAVWSAVGQDYAPRAAADRLGQLAPVLLFAADGYVFQGKARDRRDAVRELVAALPTLRHVVGVDRVGLPIDGALRFEDLVASTASFTPEPTAFADPLWVLFSSGTTGLPKGIVHSHGGVLVEQVKMAALHLDLGDADRFTWYTSPSWVVWNCVVGAMTRSGSVLCFDGAPTATGPSSLWQIVADHAVTVFGTSPGFLAASEDGGVRPGADHDLGALRLIGSTGAPLPERAYEYVAREIAPTPVFSMSGGTDIAGAFAMGSPDVPVWSGEIPVRGLGVALEAWSDAGTPLVDEVGELVVTRPMPSMPLRFWNDPDGSRYRAAYFEVFPGVWRHGDWVTVTSRGSLRVHGRSDSTINRNGVRMGSADIYAAVEAVPEIVESLVIGAEEADGGYWLVLFVVLAPRRELDDTLVAEIGRRVRDLASPRHVPDEVIAVRGVPHTRTGKKLEIPVKRLIQGADPSTVVDPSVVDDPTLLEVYEQIAARRRRVVDGRLARVVSTSRRPS